MFRKFEKITFRVDSAIHLSYNQPQVLQCCSRHTREMKSFPKKVREFFRQMTYLVADLESRIPSPSWQMTSFLEYISGSIATSDHP